MKIKTEKLKNYLVDINIITESYFEELKARTGDGESVEDVLIAEGIITEENIASIKANILGIPFIDLDRKKIDKECLKIIPESMVSSQNVVVFRKKNGHLEVAMTDPDDLETIDFIRKKTGMEILRRLTTKSGIRSCLRQYQESLDSEFESIVESEPMETKDPEKAAEEMPVVRVVDTLIKHAAIQEASDIHIEPQEEEVVVRYRIDGVLQEAKRLPIDLAVGMVARIKILADLKLDEHRQAQDGRFKFETKNSEYSVRVSTLPTSNGEKVAMRLLSQNESDLDLDKLGVRNQTLEKLKRSIKKTNGIILVTGPTGSGKTSTLYSMIEALNTPEVNISTIEDPIEYQISGINQTQVKPQAGFTFSSGLRALVRQDPDVIMVGEIRDTETAKLAINAALTGHLVLSTLHTTSSAGTIARLIDMGVEPFLVSSTLDFAIAQRLVRRIQERSERHKLSDLEIEDLGKHCDLDRVVKLFREEGVINEEETLKDVNFYRPRRREKSTEVYKGRIGIFEVLEVSDKIKELISNRADTHKIKQQAKKEGMTTLVEEGLLKAAQGITSIEEVLRVISE